MLIDTHCHLHDREFFTAEQAEAMLGAAHRCGVDKIICIGTTHADSLAAQTFAADHENVYWTYGVHPGHAGDPAAKPADSSSCVAIGEVGLDYHYEGYNRTAQIKLFENMLQLAVDHDLPLSFHVREAFDDFFPVVANFPTARGVVHSFTDNKKKLRRILNETNFCVGVNGLATYSTLPLPPLERILLETDAPFLAPVPYRGEINQPAYITDIAKWLADQLAISPDQVAQITTKNATTLFQL
ncbi:MAG: TatD family hydrolase [Candidatus Saccharibacteria bacterium]|nr:TatD family hydrolase [Candidatus Saccharibacteria bacterium]